MSHSIMGMLSPCYHVTMSHSIIGVVSGGGGDDGGAKEQNDSDCYRGWQDQHSNDRAKQKTSNVFFCLASPKLFSDDPILEDTGYCWGLLGSAQHKTESHT